ncbi:MAG: MATE family efflux transporter [Terriglobia bacterium]
MEKLERSSLRADLGEVLRLSLPIIITMGSQTMMMFVDMLLVARFGKDELAAAGPAGLTFMVFGAFMLGLVSCNNTFVSQCLGRGEPAGCGRYTVHCTCIGFLAQALMLPVIAGAPLIFRLFHHEPAVMGLEVTYFRVLGFRVAAMSMVAAVATFYQGTGRPIVPMLTGIGANALNFVLDVILIFGYLGFPRLGLFGAGIATTLASCAEATVLLALYLSSREQARYATRSWAPFEWKKVAQILRIGIAAGATFALDLGSWAIFVGVVIGRLGADVLAGNNAATSFMQLSFMPAYGLSIGLTALVGRYIGQGDYRAAKRRTYLGMACACCYMTVMGVAFYVLRRPLIGVFRHEPGVIAAGSLILKYIPLFQFADAFGIVSAGALKGAGDTRFPAAAQIVLAWLFFLPLVFVLGNPRVGGLAGAWTAATIYIWGYDLVLLWRFMGGRWRRINIFE